MTNCPITGMCEFANDQVTVVFVDLIRNQHYIAWIWKKPITVKAARFIG